MCSLKRLSLNVNFLIIKTYTAHESAKHFLEQQSRWRPMCSGSRWFRKRILLCCHFSDCCRRKFEGGLQFWTQRHSVCYCRSFYAYVFYPFLMNNICVLHFCNHLARVFAVLGEWHISVVCKYRLRILHFVTTCIRLYNQRTN
jgi:hypothetical protein